MSPKYFKLLLEGNPYGDKGDKLHSLLAVLSFAGWFIGLCAFVMIAGIFGLFALFDTSFEIIGGFLGMLGLIGLMGVILNKYEAHFNENNIPFLFFSRKTLAVKYYLLKGLGVEATNLKILPFGLKEISHINCPHKEKILKDLMESQQLAQLPSIAALYTEHLKGVRHKIEEEKAKILKTKREIENQTLKRDRLTLWTPLLMVLIWQLNPQIADNDITWGNFLIILGFCFMFVSTLAFGVFRLISYGENGHIPLLHWFYAKFGFLEKSLKRRGFESESLLELLSKSSEWFYLWEQIQNNPYLRGNHEFIKEVFGKQVLGGERALDDDLQKATLVALRHHLPQETESADEWGFKEGVGILELSDAYMEALKGKLHPSLGVKHLA